jgi:hypothetical protein
LSWRATVFSFLLHGIFVPVNCLFSVAHKRRQLKQINKVMKTKNILMITLVAVLGAGAMWLAPHHMVAAETTSAGQKILHYSCPMHPSVKADKPGDCPICGMHLVPVYETGKGTNAPSATAKTNAPMMMPGCCSAGMGH